MDYRFCSHDQLQIWIEREEALRQRSNFHRDKVVVQFYSLFEKNDLTQSKGEGGQLAREKWPMLHPMNQTHTTVASFHIL